mmetsp:Transcript_6867/g.20015  ORF Transcript_6867/g.20015 Transcript_6867/m.20015 type:complete len:91 (-) Transcript_6867:357-629(-)
MYTFSEPWPVWEMHPKGSELVVCTAGSMTLIQEVGGEELRIQLAAGEAVVNPPGVWHTGDVADGAAATALFITAGQGTEHRPREPKGAQV